MVTLGGKECIIRTCSFCFPLYNLIVILLPFLNKVVEYSSYIPILENGGFSLKSFVSIPTKLVDLYLKFSLSFKRVKWLSVVCFYRSLNILQLASSLNVHKNICRSIHILTSIGNPLRIYFEHTQSSSQNFIPDLSGLFEIY